MFSWDTVFMPDDLHSLLDMEGNLLNNKKNEIHIGKHYWVGYGCRFIHSAQIEENTIVGMNSLVNKKFTEPNIMIAGTPAHIIKRNINWDKSTPENYKNNV